jgi:GTP pyrophosphokinase
MHNSERLFLEGLVLAPYIQKATALIGRRRRVGGNQFRHAMATLAILIDYHCTDPVILKAAIIHDLFEEVPETDPDTICILDADGPAVVSLVLEVTRRPEESKPDFLLRLRDQGSERARLLKVADRISNLVDLHETVFSRCFVERYVDETEEYVLPMANSVDANMACEVGDLLARRRGLQA